MGEPESQKAVSIFQRVPALIQQFLVGFIQFVQPPH